MPMSIRVPIVITVSISVFVSAHPGINIFVRAVPRDARFGMVAIVTQRNEPPILLPTLPHLISSNAKQK